MFIIVNILEKANNVPITVHLIEVGKSSLEKIKRIETKQENPIIVKNKRIFLKKYSEGHISKIKEIIPPK
ncbi:MAG: hypothetical protein MJ252_24730 [archaeon]|nr:hypothetical protein [archaeon]